MDCKTCADLLVVYKLAVKLYLNAEQTLVERNIKQDLGKDYKAALEEAGRLRLAYQDASDAFRALAAGPPREPNGRFL